MKYHIRKTKLEDLEIVMSIYAGARKFMIDNGNPDQWGTNWPEEWIIKQDIEKQISNVVVDENDEIMGVFAFIVGIDKTYLDIREGKWNSEKEYGTIHRLASSFKMHGLFEFVMNELEKENHINYRIDTHKDNVAMNKAILNNGYKYCGIITPIEGGERVAFDKVIY